jgi:hypothetical protein
LVCADEDENRCHDVDQWDDRENRPQLQHVSS